MTKALGGRLETGRLRPDHRRRVLSVWERSLTSLEWGSQSRVQMRQCYILQARRRAGGFSRGHHRIRWELGGTNHHGVHSLMSGTAEERSLRSPPRCKRRTL